MRKLVSVLLALCGVLTLHGGAARAGSDWAERFAVPAPVGNLSFTSRWDPAQGLHLRLVRAGSQPAAATRQTVEIVLTPAKGLVDFAPKGEFPAAIQSGAQFNLAALPAEPAATVKLVLKFRPEAWTLYMNDRPVVVLPVPFLPPTSVLQATGEVPPGAPAPLFQKVADFALTDDFMVAEADQTLPAGWEVASGTWSLHSAFDSSVERQLLPAAATNRPIAARSPNFYSLQGKGKSAIILAGYDFYDTYRFESAMQTVPGESGLVFYAQEDGTYFAFTVTLSDASRAALLRLWRIRSPAHPQRQVLAAAATQLLPGQWMKLKVAIFPNRVQCFLDNTRVMDQAVELPAGGRFGLYADTASGARFDDVAAGTNHDLDLAGAVAIRRHTVFERGSFFRGASFLSLFTGDDESNAPGLRISASRQEQWLVLGSPLHPGNVFAADFTPGSSTYSVGLVAGWTGAEAAHYRFVCSGKRGTQQFQLQSVLGDMVRVLEDVTLDTPPAVGNAPATLTLMCDATAAGELRCYRNGELVLIHQPAKPVAGASGLYVGPRTKTQVAGLSYTFERRDQYRNRFEKNRVYIEDPFMRHWSSPEGEWADDDKGNTWHKGDFYGRFLASLPFVVGSQVHLGVAEGHTEGAYAVCAGPDGLEIRTGALATKSQPPLQRIPASALVDIPPPEGKPSPGKGYTINYEGWWLWVSSGDKVLAKLKVAAPLAGHRLRIAGFNTEQLQNSYVERFNVKDFLFTESLHEWVLNGGSWEVVNRFSCRPEWSHMNGESKDTVAALWAKYLASGDFCVEMYAGMRMGWYGRGGDLNMTVMNHDTTPSQGYTVTCTGWDEDHSQLNTRLYRDGTLFAESKEYCVPRVREGSRRKVLDPLIKPGRDMHGAWYYMKFRRVGTHLQYFFDNQLVFETEDKNPLNNGGLGIWTYMNSMMVARVKIAAQNLAPQQVRFTTLDVSTGQSHPAAAAKVASLDTAAVSFETIADEELALLQPQIAAVPPTSPDEPVAAVAKPTPAPATGDAPKKPGMLAPADAGVPIKAPVAVSAKPALRLLNADRPVNLITPELWTPDDPVGHAELSWHNDPAGQLFLMLRNVLGSGPLLARCSQTTVAAADLAGWRLTLKRTARAQFNLHYAVGHLNAAGTFVPERQFFEVLTGSELETASYVRAGHTEVPASTGAARAGLLAAPWQTVTVWLPPELRRQAAVDASLMVALVGIGNLQPSYVMQGLTGNGPGEGYAVRTICEVRYSPPRLILSGTPAASADYALTATGNGVKTTQFANLAGVQAWCDQQAATGQTTALLELRSALQSSRWELSWIKLPDLPDVVCAWAPDKDGAVEFRCRAPYPDPRFAAALVQVQDQAMRVLDASNVDTLLVGVPRKEELLPPKQPELAFKFNLPGNRVLPFSLAWKDAPLNRPPALLGITGLTPFLETYEAREFPCERAAEPNRMRLPCFDPVQGAFLEVFNPGSLQRLNTPFTVPLSLAKFPVFAFRYRGTEMSHVSLSLRDRAIIELGEKAAKARTVRGGVPMTLDQKWYSWCGLVTDAMVEWPLVGDGFNCAYMRFGSAHEYDQTGLFTHWDCDDLVFGPALPAAKGAVTFTPRYLDADGVAEILATIRSGPESAAALPPEALAKLAWQKASPGAVISMDTLGLPDGFAHLLLKARDSRGLESQVTDIPLLVDSKSPEVVQPTAGTSWFDPNSNEIKVGFRIGGGAPLDLNALAVKWNETTVPIPNQSCTLQHSPDLDTLVLNWPRLFRQQYREIKTGETNRVVITSLKDGAGNAAPDVTVPIVIDFAKDHTPPTVLAIAWPANVMWCGKWDSTETSDPLLQAVKPNTADIMRKAGEETYVQALVARDNADFSVVFDRGAWDVDLAPWLAFRMRRPKLGKDDKVRIDLVLECDNRDVFIIPLTHKDEGRNVLPLPAAITWKADTWEPVTLNLKEMFAALHPDDKDGLVCPPAVDGKAAVAVPAVKHRIAALRFRVTNAPRSYGIHLQSLMVLSPWKTDAKLDFDAFDASGIAGLTWYVGDKRTEEATAVLGLAAVPVPDKVPAWMSVMVRDKAGNLTYPIRIPLPPK